MTAATTELTELTNFAPPDRPGVIDLLLRHRAIADDDCADAERAARLLPRLVLTTVGGVGAFSLVQGLLLTTAAHAWPAGLAEAHPLLAVGGVFAAFEFGLMGTQIAALPTFYFHALLAGLRTHAWRITVESLRARATASVVLLGLLPIYLALALGFGLLAAGDSRWAELHSAVVLCGYALPLVAGLAAPLSLLRAFRRMAGEREEDGRRPMPTLLVMAWSALFTVMAPLGIARMLGLLGAL